MQRGRDTLGPEVREARGLDQALVGLLYDAETSGGLLIVVPPEAASALETELRARDLPVHAIGEFVSGPAGIELV